MPSTILKWTGRKVECILQKLNEWLLCARYNSKYFTHVNLPNTQNNPKKYYFNFHFMDEETKA